MIYILGPHLNSFPVSVTDWHIRRRYKLVDLRKTITRLLLTHCAFRRFYVIIIYSNTFFAIIKSKTVSWPYINIEQQTHSVFCGTTLPYDATNVQLPTSWKSNHNRVLQAGPLIHLLVGRAYNLTSVLAASLFRHSSQILQQFSLTSYTIRWLSFATSLSKWTTQRIL
jgi:hypothetical protein